ncbi:type VI secretion system amidase effector protein Tae4 [Chryseobacterium jejuense]|uniref:type VI secretion system amidase effector protein Tae4 n=1 Tax=Chryseobacterium jejuense TaxID=445960 RepID=UPI001AEACBDB|nr:type VI secretion system amidase effector protein Tae4 [Chryseobacterium jejuense]MBP2615073.1 hypothetical protein [Chryseobacterium jejuense]
MIRFDILWKNHPGTLKPCNVVEFPNQCAIRMSEAFNKSGVDLASFSGAKCWEKYEDKFRHILRAQELANWVDKHPEVFGNTLKLQRKKHPTMSSKSFRHKGLIFIKDGWGATDHIDLWDKNSLRAGSVDYLSLGIEIWFWPLI